MNFIEITINEVKLVAEVDTHGVLMDLKFKGSSSSCLNLYRVMCGRIQYSLDMGVFDIKVGNTRMDQ